MSETTHTPVERRLYEPRSGEGVEHYAAVLDAAPEFELDEVQKAELADWNAALTTGHVTIGEETYGVEAEGGFESYATGKSYTSYELNLDYFDSPAGKELLRSKNIHLPHDADKQDLLAQAFLGMPKETAKDIQLASKQAEDERMAQQLVAGETPTPPTRMTVFTNTGPLFENLQGLKAYKQFFRELREPVAVDEQDPVMLDAKRTYLDLYQKVINAKLATLYPDILAFWYQAKHFDEPQRSVTVGAVEHAWPLVSHLREDFLKQRARSLFVRLDHVRNGASKDHAGAYVSISAELQDYLTNPPKKAEQEHPTVFTPEETAVMDKVVFDADDMKDMAEHLFRELDMLSEDTTYPDKTRPHRAHDGKWQVVVRDDITAMGVEDPPGVFEIPAKFKRSLTKASAPVGALPGLAHEFTHVVQYDNLRSQPNEGIGGIIKGKNQTVYAEAGSIRVEEWLQDTWFGRQRETAPHYTRAMQALQSGEGEGEALQAFYDSYSRANPNETPKACADVAVSRVMRLARRRGGYNSQPLNYAETALLIDKTEELSDHVKGLLFEYANFSIDDLAKLHRFGLLPKHVNHFPYQKFTDIVVPYIKDKIASLT